jgi:hypothetical protein
MAASICVKSAACSTRAGEPRSATAAPAPPALARCRQPRGLQGDMDAAR